jgi:ribosome-associated toxin RatA of RatAB toxin-antitoxin module
MVEEAHQRISVDAPPERCWDIATDYERYPTWAKDVKSVAVLERDPDGRGSLVEYRVAGLGRSIRYVLEYDYAAAPGSFSWQLVDGDILRRLDGRYGFEEEGAGTRVTYDLAVEVAIPMPGVIKRRAAGMIMGTALRELKKEAEMTEPLRDLREQPRNPDHEEPEDAGATVDDGAGMTPPEAADHGLRAAPDSPGAHSPDADGPGQPPPSAIESLVNALLEAGPEVAEHVVRSAQELLLAAQCVVDAAQKAVQEQQDLRRADSAPPEPGSSRRLDVAE